MKEDIQSARTQVQQNSEETKKREWFNENLALFEQTIRENQTDLTKLCNITLSTLTKQINANQGMIYLSDGQEHLEVIAAIAWDRTKYLDKKTHIKDGLIGRCYQEKKPIILTDIPKNYIKITSGMGKALPRFILIVPLIKKENVLGIIELASFASLEKHQLDLVYKFCDSMASSIESIQINQHTKELLEQHEVLSEELKVKEEEMRQQIEELSATQEETSQNEKILRERISELEDLIHNKNFTTGE